MGIRCSRGNWGRLACVSQNYWAGHTTETRANTTRVTIRRSIIRERAVLVSMKSSIIFRPNPLAAHD